MSLELFTAELAVPKAGYEWCDAGGVGITEQHQHVGYDDNGEEVWEAFPVAEVDVDYYLAPKGRGDIPARKFDPFKEHTGMFREFANLAASEAAILKFANRYGWLGTPYTVVKASELPAADAPHDELWAMAKNWPPDGLPAFSAESMSAWSLGISKMKEAVSLWDELRAEQRETKTHGFRQPRADDEIARVDVICPHCEWRQQVTFKDAQREKVTCQKCWKTFPIYVE